MTKISEDLLQGKTLKVYWFLLEHANSGVREIDRQLGFNSPSTVLYHINKLVEVGLVEKTTQDKYTAKEYVSSGILGLYLKIGPKMIPRIVFYLSFFIAFLVLYFFLLISRNPFVFYFEDFFTILISLSGIFFFTIEFYRIWTLKPL
ncbi:MAG: ArsR family transcriptional regulator [Candidatus Heimdallarchaeota archaeon]|nr:ArsR family transcriptional regulator [Candidatus Heimdallarchaeota archaeon]